MASQPHNVITVEPQELLNEVRRKFVYRDGSLFRNPSLSWPGVSHDRMISPVGRASSDRKPTGDRRYRKVYLCGREHSIHRLVWLMHKGTLPECVDHVNGDWLDNRIENLRGCARIENSWNRRRHCSLTGKKGVTPSGDRFRASISCRGTAYDLGTYATTEEAAAAYDGAAIVLHGEFAATNRDLTEAK